MNKLTKLASLGLLSAFFVVNAMPVFAEHSTSTPASPRVVDATCMSNAVDKRDNAIVAAMDVYHASVRTALLARRDAVKAAWQQTDATKRRDALKVAYTTYHDTVKAARKVWRDARNTDWKQFRTDRKACGATSKDTVRDENHRSVDNQI